MDRDTLNSAQRLLEFERRVHGDKDIFGYAKRAFDELESVLGLISVLKTNERIFEDVPSETRKGIVAVIDMLERSLGIRSVRDRHHVWCNNFHLPVENCKMCQGLWERYPYDTPEEMNDLYKKYFPDAVKRT